MPPTACASVWDLCYYAINRDNGGAQVFYDASEREGSGDLIGEACQREQVRVSGSALMPHHSHLVLWSLPALSV